MRRKTPRGLKLSMYGPFSFPLQASAFKLKKKKTTKLTTYTSRSSRENTKIKGSSGWGGGQGVRELEVAIVARVGTDRERERKLRNLSD